MSEEMQKNLNEVITAGYVSIGKKLRSYSVAVASGDPDLQEATRRGTLELVDTMLDGIRDVVGEYVSSTAAGENSLERVSEKVTAVVDGPGGKKVIN